MVIRIIIIIITIINVVFVIAIITISIIIIITAAVIVILITIPIINIIIKSSFFWAKTTSFTISHAEYTHSKADLKAPLALNAVERQLVERQHQLHRQGMQQQ